MILTMEKKQEIIGSSISKLHQEYIQYNQLEIDIGRPILKIYTDAIMEYCVPVKIEFNNFINAKPVYNLWFTTG